MAIWIVRPGGRIVRFRNRQARHRCSRRRKGRPAVGNGLCYGVNAARAARHDMNAQLRRQVRDGIALHDITLVVPHPGCY